ncbi:MAG TPA: AAA family ATPase, partial [Roseiflexaceae bacterium]|nr:AAA family ATPase [Roseiflexaceae bacterium]
MALEPQHPERETRYRDDLDREIDQKIDTMLHRWPWKVLRTIRRIAVVLFVIWLLLNLIPTAMEFLLTQPLGPVILQIITMGAYLFVFIGFQFGLMYFFMARTRIYWLKPGETGVSFKDYKGNPEVLEAATRIVTLLKGVKEFKSMGGEVTRGVLLLGPPGTGKSYLAQAISTEAGVPFGYLSAPSLTSVWMGMGNIKVMRLYTKARKLAKEYGACILFIDEIDAIGGARSASMAGGAMGGMSPANRNNVMMGGMGGMGGNSGLLNELLLQMDPPPHETGVIKKALRWLGLRRKRAEMPAVLTMGATNMAETLDAALLRPGRFDRKIAVDLPDADGRREIIQYYLSKVKHEPMPIDRMVSDTITYTPVAIKFVINEATIHAHFDGRQAINYWDFTRAREGHDWGLKQPIRGMSYEERRRLAYHEAGHAYAAVKLLYKWRLSKVTIIRHGGALGFAGWKPEEETYTHTKTELLNRIQISLASRAAEELFLDIQMSGVTGDLNSATSLAVYMLGMYGLGDSLFSYAALGGVQPDGALREPVEKLIAEEYRKVKKLLEENKDAVIAIAEALILRNELTDIDVDEILARVEAEHQFVNPSKRDERPSLGFSAPRALPEATNGRRNGKHAPRTIEPVIIPTAARPTEPPSSPSAELGEQTDEADDAP